MTTEKVSLNQFIIALCESPNRWIQQATDGLTDEQLYYQPSSDTNSIASCVQQNPDNGRVPALVKTPPLAGF